MPGFSGGGLYWSLEDLERGREDTGRGNDPVCRTNSKQAPEKVLI